MALLLRALCRGPPDLRIRPTVPLATGSSDTFHRTPSSGHMGHRASGPTQWSLSLAPCSLRSPTFRTLNNYWWKDYCRPWNDSWWTFNGRLSIVERQWSTISGRPSKATNDGRPRSVTIDRQPWIVNHCRSIIGSRLLMCEY